MANRLWALLCVSLICQFCAASIGDRDPAYRSCLDACEKDGCVNGLCFPSCGATDENLQEPFYTKINKWDCPTECRYQCMVHREAERSMNGEKPVKYHGKWPFERILGMQEPASVAFSILNLFLHIWGLASFLRLVYHKLPLRPHTKKDPYYEFVGLWTIYGLLSVNSWFWSAIFHTSYYRDMPITESLDYSSAIALLGFSLILAILRVCNIRSEATRVMISAPIIGFVATHIFYLNFYDFDYGWNMKVCVVMGVGQLLIWSIWGGVSKHPCRWMIWMVVMGTLVAMMLELYDFSPIGGHFDAHSIWHASTLPLTYVWWSFVKKDTAFTTMKLSQNSKGE